MSVERRLTISMAAIASALVLSVFFNGTTMAASKLALPTHLNDGKRACTTDLNDKIVSNPYVDDKFLSCADLSDRIAFETDLNDKTAVNTDSEKTARNNYLDDKMADLKDKIASVLPDKQEDAWLKVGWHTNLMQARELAQKENRPLFLWIMNGHPLGCT